jgi:hypothetical protein
MISKLPINEVPSPEILAALSYGWDNEGMAATAEYLEEMVRIAAQVRGPILECGSGLTTLVLGLLAKKQGVTVWTLEHLPEWHERVRRVLVALNITNVELCLAPLRDFQAFVWYDAPAERMPREFSFVVCDGPPVAPGKSARGDAGARYGLLPVLGAHLARECIILLDDAQREEEALVTEVWKRNFGAHITVIGKSRKFALIRPGATPRSPES